jgi:hypothetical protein
MVAVLAVLLASCALGGSRDNPFSETNSQKEIKVFITNLAFMDATVYAVTNGSRRRLGRVTGKRESRFTIPFPVAADFWLEVDILAGPKCRTERMTVSPGEHLELVIQTNNPYLFCAAES